jgi:lipopolysaccharide export LptBFGC system permease protein LptF
MSLPFAEASVPAAAAGTLATGLAISMIGLGVWWVVRKTINIFDRYIWNQVWSGTLTGVLVLSGVMVLGNVYKKLDQLLGDARLPFSKVLDFVLLVIPFSLTFTIPWAFLTSILLSFGRMSADNEVTALRMTGQSMWRICRPVFLMSLLLASSCYYVNTSMAPAANREIKQMFFALAVENPINLFQPGKVLDKLPGYRVYVKDRIGEDRLKDLRIVVVEGTEPKQVYLAKEAKLVREPGKIDFKLELKNATIEMAKEGSTGAIEGLTSISVGDTAIDFPLEELKKKTQKINASMKSTPELWQEMGSAKDRGKKTETGTDAITGLPLDRTEMSVARTELSKRYSFSLASIIFCLVGIPLGVTAQRKETTLGFVLSLVTAIAYFFLITIAEQQSDSAGNLPHLQMWVPNVIFAAVGLVMFWKLSRK